MGIYSHCISPFIIFLNIKEASLSKVIPLLPNLLLPSLGGVGGGFYLYKLVPLLYLYLVHIFPYQC